LEQESARVRDGERKRWLIWAIGVAAVLVLAAALDASAGLTDLGCAVCHREIADATDISGHQGVSCLSCHLEAGAWSYPAFKVAQWTRMYPSQLLGRTPRPTSGVSRAACEKCHEPATLQSVVGEDLRIAHDSCVPATGRCDTCHGGVAHGDLVRWAGQPEMDACITCHEKSAAPRACDICHEPEPEIALTRKGPVRAVHGPEWDDGHGMLGSTKLCARCHEAASCGECHGAAVPHPAEFTSTHGDAALSADAQCDTCHSAKQSCDKCHGVPMPHGDRFLAEHFEVADGYEDPKCISCHEVKACTGCHDRHVHPGNVNAFRDVGAL